MILGLAIGALVAAFFVRHPLVWSFAGLVLLLLILGALDGEPGLTLVVGLLATLVVVAWKIRPRRRDLEARDRARGWRLEPYVCSECEHPWEQYEVWDRHERRWVYGRAPYGFCPVCHPEYALPA